MTCPRRHLTNTVFLALLAGFAAGPALAQVKPCEELKEEIAEKIRNNGVPAFDLFILPRDQETPWKIVGTCNGGQSKIAYARGTPREQAAALRAFEATGPDPGPASAPVPASASAPAPAPAPAATDASPQAGDAGATTNPGAGIWAAGEVRQCHMVRPRGWLTDRTLYGDSAQPPATGSPIRAYEIDILPPSGHPLALKGIVFSFRIRPHYLHELRPLMLAAYPDAGGFNAMIKEPADSLAGDERDFSSSMASHASASPDEWKRARAVAGSPGLIDGVGVVRLQVAQDVEWKPVDGFLFRAREQGEETAGVKTHRIGVWSDGHALRTQAVLNPVYRSPSGGGPLTERLVYEYGCWASNAMSAREFASVCSAFIERSTLGPRFPAASCVAAPEGIAFAPR